MCTYKKQNRAIKNNGWVQIVIAKDQLNSTYVFRLQINFRSFKVLYAVQAIVPLCIKNITLQPTTNFCTSMHKEAGNHERLQNDFICALDCSFNKIPLEKTGCWPVSCSSTFDARVSLSPDSPTQMLRQSF